MAKMSKKEIEKYYFDRLRGIYRFPQGTVTHGDRPDVILAGDRKIGIEITNFFLEDGSNPDSEQAQRKRREKVVAQAHEHYLANGGRKIDVWFSFDKNSPIRNGDALAVRMAEFIKTIERQKTGIVNRESFKDMLELSEVYLNAEEYSDPKWRVNQVYSPPLMREGDLQAIIDDKAAKVEAYEKCDAYWLLVVIDSWDRAQEQQTSGIDLQPDLKGFEKLLIYNTRGHIIEKNK